MATVQQESAPLGPSAILLVALSFFIIVTPILRHAGIHAGIIGVGSSLVLLAAVYFAQGKRSHLIIASLLALPALGAQLEAPLFGTGLATYPRLLCSAALLFYASTLILMALTRQTRVSTDTVIGGVNIYLLLIIGFTFIHALAEYHTPGAYSIGGQPLTDIIGAVPHGDSISTLLYFSAVTMTTLGYGDIVPKTPVARTFAAMEAVTGQMYLAVLVARLVGMHIAHAHRKSAADNDAPNT
jgi:hypothetical protein